MVLAYCIGTVVAMLELKSTDAPSGLERTVSYEAGAGELVDRSILFLRRRYFTIGVVFFLIISTAILYLKVTSPTFTASVDIILGKPIGQFIPRQSTLTEPTMDVYNLESQIQIIRSDKIANLVVRRLRLDIDPEFVGSSGGTVGIFSRLLQSEPRPNGSEFAQRAIFLFQKNLDVTRVGISYVVNISYSSTSAEKSALIANTIADEFIAEQGDVKYQERRIAGDWLFERANQLREQTEAAERAVMEFKKNNNIVTVSGNLLNEQQVSELTAQLAIARQKSAEAATRVNQIRSAILSVASTNPLDATASVDSLANPALTKMRQKYMDLSAEEREMVRKFGENSGAATILHNQMIDLNQPIQDEIRRLGETYKSDFEAAKQRQEAIEKDLEEAVNQSQAASKAKIALQELESVAHSNRVLYDSFMQRSKESFQEESFPLSDARIISPAVPPQQKSRPRTTLVLALAAMGGVALGVGLGLLRDLLDGAFRTGEQVETYLRLPCIALVPQAKNFAQTRTPIQKRPIAANIGFRVIQRGSQVFWTIAKQPSSRFAEAVRSIKFALDQATASNGCRKIVGFTSSLPNEGKSTVTAAFGLLAAQVGARAIVVDLDFRNPMLSRMLAPDAEVGIVDVLMGRSTLDSAIWIEPTSSMTFLPVSPKSHLLHTTEVLRSVAMKQLFDKLHQEFEYVIVDLPPLVPVVDARATTEIIDSYFLVVEWGRTKTSVVLKALDTAATLSERLVGIILNKAVIKNMRMYDSNSNSYYNNADFARYGYTE
jgi:polysaccharide biosynthesis transport protein